jgi:hypothetical protein
LSDALATAAQAAGLAFRVVEGAEGGDGANATAARALGSLAAALAGARVLVGRGAPDLAAAAAAAPPGCALVELVPVEGHPGVEAVVRARGMATTCPSSSARPCAVAGAGLASHELWVPHPPGGAVGPHLAWADADDGARYGAWARPDCAAGALHGGDCAAAAARAGLDVAGPADVAAVVDAALRGLYAAEAVAGVGLSDNGERGGGRGVVA